MALVCFLSFAVITHSDPPEGYQEAYYYFHVKNGAGQYIVGATAALSDSTWVDWGHTNLTSGVNGDITMHFVYPEDPDLNISVEGIQVTFSAYGYQNKVYYLGSSHSITIRLDPSY